MSQPKKVGEFTKNSKNTPLYLKRILEIMSPIEIDTSATHFVLSLH